MRKRLYTYGGALGAIVAAVALAACGGGTSGTPHASNAASAAPSPKTDNITLKLAGSKLAKSLGYTTPDGKGHDTFIPSNMNVGVGDTVHVTVVNYDEGPHTMTAPGLNLNLNVPGAVNADKKIPSKTTFTFVAKQAGKYRWFCTLPCDAKAHGWAMTPSANGPAQDGYMAGYITVS